VALFECHWRRSLAQMAVYITLQACCVLSLLHCDLPWWSTVAGLLICSAHAMRIAPRDILRNAPSAVTGLRHDESGWQLYSLRDGWQHVQLLPSSVALPFCVLLSFKRGGDRFGQAVLLTPDVLPPASHRRLRTRLQFSRKRWAVPALAD
jgi:toxin CptA